MESYSLNAVLGISDKEFKEIMKSTTESLEKIKKSAASAKDTIKKISSGLGVFKAVTAGTDLLKKSIPSAFNQQDAMDQFSRTITSITGSTDAAGNALNNLKGITKGTAYGLDVAAKATQNFVTRGMDVDSAAKSVGAWADAVSFYGKGTSDQFTAVTDAIGNMRKKGTVEMDQLNSLFNVGIDAVGMYAKAVGRDSSSVQADLSSGKISAEDFLNTVETAMMEGTNGVQKIAGAAKDTEAGWNSTFDSMEEAVTRGTTGVINSIDNMLENNGFPTIRESVKAFGDAAESVLGRVSGFIERFDLSALVDQVKPYFNVLKNALIELKDLLGPAFSTVGDSIGKITGSLKDTKNISAFQDAVSEGKDVLKTFAKFLEEHADAVAKVIVNLPKLLAAYKGFKILKTIVTLVGGFTGAVAKLTKLGLNKIAPKLFKVAEGQDKVGKSSEGNADKMTASAKAFMMIGAGVALIAGGFLLLAEASIRLSDSGGLAIGIMAVMAGTVIALAFGMMSLLKDVKTTPSRFNAVSDAFLKMGVGIAIVAGSLAVLALALVPLASLGSTAVPPLLAFGVVVGGLGIILGMMGQKLQESAIGIAVFAAAVSVMALAMVPLAQTGQEGAIAMGAFGLVIGGLALIFGLFGSAINAAIPGMIAIGVIILAVGAAMALAGDTISLLPPVIQQLGETFSLLAVAIAAAVSIIVTTVGDTLCNIMITAGDIITGVIDSISEGFTSIIDSISGVIDAISGGFSSVLDSIAGVIESVGNSARNAGEGFKAVAVGIGLIAELSGYDIATALGTVALALGAISTKGAGLQETANGLSGIITNLMAAALVMTAFSTGVSMMSMAAVILQTAVSGIKETLSNFILTPPDITPVISSFMLLAAVSRSLILELTAAGMLGGEGLAIGIQTGCIRAQNIVILAVLAIITASIALTNGLMNTASLAMNGFNSILSIGFSRARSVSMAGGASIVSTLSSVPGQMYSLGYFIGMGLANGMESTLWYVRLVAAQLAAAAEEAVIAKSKIGSPSRVFRELGEYIGEGFAIGIKSMFQRVYQVSEDMVLVPSVASGTDIMGTYSTGMSQSSLKNDYIYNPAVYVNAEVTSVMDGKEVGYGSARYVQEKNESDAKIRRYINGIR